VREGAFREDLLYRLRVARLSVPPLRERLSDLPILARTLQQRAEARMNLPAKPLADDALQALLTHDWPGNVRELRNAITSALIRASGPTVRASDLPPEVGGNPDGSSFSAASAPEAERLRAALHETDGNRSAAADLLGISRSTLYRRLREYDLQE
jgi:DNA-binding NtrC family response regulator